MTRPLIDVTSSPVRAASNLTWIVIEANGFRVNRRSAPAAVAAGSGDEVSTGGGRGPRRTLVILSLPKDLGLGVGCLRLLG